jgi:hypothetical protein
MKKSPKVCSEHTKGLFLFAMIELAMTVWQNLLYEGGKSQCYMLGNATAGIFLIVSAPLSKNIITIKIPLSMWHTPFLNWLFVRAVHVKIPSASVLTVKGLEVFFGIVHKFVLGTTGAGGECYGVVVFIRA